MDQGGAIHNFVRNLAIAVSTVSLYSAEHIQVQSLCRATLSDLEEAMGAKGELSLVVIDNQLVVEGIPLGEGLHLARFARTLASRGIGHVRISRGVTLVEIRSMVESLSRRNTGGEIRSLAHIRFGKVEVRFAYGGNGSEAGGHGFAGGERMSAEESAQFNELYAGIRKHKKLKVAGLMEIVSGFIATVRNEADPLLALAPLRSSDEYTFTHCANICILNLAQAMAIGIQGPLLHDIGVAAMLHDVGKFFVPEEVLNKPGRLDDSEWELIRQHPVMGAQYLLDTPGVPHLAVITAFEHHLKHDLSGYPRVPEGWQQNLCSQMTTISDIFDALRTKRPYCRPKDMDEISGIMLGLAGTELHPVLTRNFFKIMGEFTPSR